MLLTRFPVKMYWMVEFGRTANTSTDPVIHSLHVSDCKLTTGGDVAISFRSTRHAVGQCRAICGISEKKRLNVEFLQLKVFFKLWFLWLPHNKVLYNNTLVKLKSNFKIVNFCYTNLNVKISMAYELSCRDHKANEEALDPPILNISGEII